MVINDVVSFEQPGPDLLFSYNLILLGLKLSLVYSVGLIVLDGLIKGCVIKNG